MTSTETKAEIVKILKGMGLNSRQVSVRIKRGGYEAVVYVQVRDAAADFEAIEKACESFESVGRDEATGEILAGGNTFVWVKKRYN